MPVSELCIREVVILHRGDSALEAARLMREHHVGDVIVVEAVSRVPLGIITDRDLVVEIMAMEIAPGSVTAGEIMSSDISTIDENRGLFEALAYMRSLGVRRLPVVNAEGGLVGILTLDDILDLLAEELSDISRLLKCERNKEMRRRA